MNVNGSLMRKILTGAVVLGASVILIASCMTVVDTSEVGIKFKKFSLTD